MVSRSPDEAVVRFIELLRSTTNCITEVPLTALPPHNTLDLYQIIFHDGDPVQLRTERGYPNVLFSLVHHCRPVRHATVAGRYTVSSTYYTYEIIDLDERNSPLSLASCRREPGH